MKPFSRILALCLAATSLIALVGCDLFDPPVPNNNNNNTNDDNTNNNSNTTSRRELPADFLTRKAVAYSGYRNSSNSDADAPSQAQIDQDLQLMYAKGYKLLRLFGSSDIFVKPVLQRIQALGLDIKVQLGVWISGPKATSDSVNQAEISRAVALANTYSTIVSTVSVGNETMVYWSGYVTPVADMVGYIKQVRDQISQPVTTDDNWAFFADKDDSPTPDTIFAGIDYVSIHTYPLLDSIYSSSSSDIAYWNWKQESTAAASRASAMMAAAIGKAKADYNAVKTYLSSKGYDSLPIIIGETGWKDSPTHSETYRAHPVNQKLYLDALNAWTDGPAQIFYFEAFDEPWKGADDGWGLWKVDRSEKYILSGTGYTTADAVYYLPTVANGTITANTYLTYADSVTAVAGSVAVPTGPNTPVSEFMGWDTPWTATASEITASGSDTAAEGSKYLQITPVSKSWGWGFFQNLKNAEDLSNFRANGHLHLSLRTSYAGKLEIGFFTGSTSANSGVDVYLPIASGTYGYVNDGAWHDVSIPISAIAAKAAPAYGQPSTAALNMALVTNAFVIADRYAVTGNSAGSSVKLDLDHVYWTQD